MFKGISFVAALVAGSAAFAHTGQTGHDGHGAMATGKAMLQDAKGQPVGSVDLKETSTGVLLTVDLKNVAPGVKAFHIHDAGSCQPPKFDSAGPHFAPDKTAHGLLNAKGPHNGDLPNVHVPESGVLSFEVLAPGVTLGKDPKTSLFDANGSALVLHSKADDYATDPSGNAGDRIACGVVTK
jgi:superoxide dismutase, Cu-Zn family